MILDKKALEAIKERERKATKGPWAIWDTKDEQGDRQWAVNANLEEATAADIEFIEKSRTDIPNLIETVEASWAASARDAQKIAALMEENEELKAIFAERKYESWGRDL